jgi:hypothetical protein
MAKNYSGSNRESLGQMKSKDKDSSSLSKQGIDYIAQAQKGGMASKMAHKGNDQGNMSCVSDDMNMKDSAFSQRGFSKTNEYIERQDMHQEQAAKDINKQEYKGRYS